MGVEKNGKEKEAKEDPVVEEKKRVMQRLKSRLSMRGKKKEKINAPNQEKECNGTNKEAEKEEEVEKKAKEDPVVEEKKWVSGSKETGEKEPEKEEEKEKETEKDEKKKSDSNAS